MPNKQPLGAGSEPIETPASHGRHAVTFTKFGWFHYAYCTCGWVECAIDRATLSARAIGHDLRQEGQS